MIKSKDFKCENCGVNLLTKRVADAYFILDKVESKTICSSCFKGKYLSHTVND